MESSISNTCYAIRDSNRNERGTTIESKICNTRHTIWDNTILTSSNQRIGGNLNNCAAILTTIVNGITAFDCYGSKPRATRESPFPNARYAIWDGDGGEGGATIESFISNACDAVGDGDRGESIALRECSIFDTRDAIRNRNTSEGRAVKESKITYLRYTVDDAIMGNGLRNGNGGKTRVVTSIYRIRYGTRYLYGIRCGTAGDVVVQVA